MTHWLTDSLTGVKCRATSVAKKEAHLSQRIKPLSLMVGTVCWGFIWGKIRIMIMMMVIPMQKKAKRWWCCLCRWWWWWLCWFWWLFKSAKEAKVHFRIWSTPGLSSWPAAMTHFCSLQKKPRKENWPQNTRLFFAKENAKRKLTKKRWKFYGCPTDHH